MHAQSIVAALATVAIAVSASPLEARNEPAPAPSCAAPSTPKCCKSVDGSLLDLIGLGAGLDCLDILGNVCGEQTTCCTSGAQYGLIDVDLVCTLTNL